MSAPTMHDLLKLTPAHIIGSVLDKPVEHKHDPEILAGLSTAVKPVDRTAGSIFLETDTSKLFSWTGSQWVWVTIDAATNTLQNVAISPRIKRTGYFQAAGGSTATTVGALTGMLQGHVGTGAGTNTVTVDTVEGVVANYVSTATGNLNVGLVAGTGVTCRRLFGCKMRARVKISSTTTSRMYVGFAGAALAISDTPIASGVAGVLVGFISSEANFSIYHNDETGAFSTTPITGSIAKDANWHTIQIEWEAGIPGEPGSVDVIFDGTKQTLSSNIPLTTSNLFFNCVGQTTTTTARTFSIHDVWIEAEK